MGDRIGTGFGDMIAGNRHRIEVFHFIFNKIGLNIGHHPEREFGRKYAGILTLIFLEDIGLDGAADGFQHPSLDFSGFLRLWRPTLFLPEGVQALGYGGI